MFKEIFTESKAKWKGGPDSYQSKREIENLIAGFDYYVGYIDDGVKYRNVKDNNNRIVQELDKLGVTHFTPIGGKEIKVSNYLGRK
jgi:hypothetical protein